ncbi:MAG: ubiquinone/menaquinone biosynthesis methyltransferase [Desulfobulbaceae bacterium]|nr:ubiquinone/menaquinone biosynthesis methyltransferase [Desulfobulbaceae bacterium]
MHTPQQPEEKKQFVREKFSSISTHYDLLNSLLSLHIDRYWRWRTTRQLKHAPNGWVLDLCAGTLPLALELTRQAPGRRVLAVDFCEDMLRAGISRLPKDGVSRRIHPVCGDGEAIPVASSSCKGCTIAFGIRNLGTAERGLSEMHRILEPGGRLIILEFSRPTSPLIKPLYNFYLNKVLPVIAGRISGDKEAYQYLASSIAAFYEPQTLLGLMQAAGFQNVHRIALTFGIVSMYIGDVSTKGNGVA